MALPETDLHRIRLWARERVPEHLWDQVKVEADASDRYVDIVEVRPPWDGVGEHTRFPIARLRYTKASGLWAIYWRDRNLKFHEYTRKRVDQERPRAPGSHREQRRPDLLGLAIWWQREGQLSRLPEKKSPGPLVTGLRRHRSPGRCQSIPVASLCSWAQYCSV